MSGDKFTCYLCKKQRDTEEDSYIEIGNGEHFKRICMTDPNCADEVERFTERLADALVARMIDE